MKNNTIKLAALIIAVNFFSFKAMAQDAESSIKQTINNFFTAMHNSDSAKAQICFASNAILQTIHLDKDGNTKITTDSVSLFLKNIKRFEAGSLDEQITFSAIQHHEQLATAWVPYKFYFNKEFSHCGINAIQLIMYNKKWLIQSIIDTRLKDPCPLN